jgi:hypothetical protein
MSVVGCLMYLDKKVDEMLNASDSMRARLKEMAVSLSVEERVSEVFLFPKSTQANPYQLSCMYHSDW